MPPPWGLGWKEPVGCRSWSSRVMVEVSTSKRAAIFLREPSRLSTASRMRSRRSFDRGWMSHLLLSNDLSFKPCAMRELTAVSACSMAPIRR